MSANEGKAPRNVQQQTTEKGFIDLGDRQLAKALSHSTRVRCLGLLITGEWSPTGLSKELKIGLSNISYHVKVLRDFELIELVKTEPRRGATEHFYRAVDRIIVPEAMSSALPKTAQMETMRTIIKLAEKDVQTSLTVGTFHSRPDFHTSWSPVLLDDQGRTALHGMCDQFIEDVIQLEADSTQRVAKAKKTPCIPTSVVLFAFGSARALSGKDGTAPKEE